MGTPTAHNTGLTGVESTLDGTPNRPMTYGECNRDIIRPLLQPSALYFVALAISVSLMLYGGWYWFQQIF